MAGTGQDRLRTLTLTPNMSGLLVGGSVCVQQIRRFDPDALTWNDINKQSVFNGPEVSMQNGLRHLKGEEHRE
jgi:hypothetical protein